MAAVGQVDNCILSVLAHIAAPDLASEFIWGKEFISDVSFIVLHYGLHGIQIQNGRRWPFLIQFQSLILAL